LLFDSRGEVLDMARRIARCECARSYRVFQKDSRDAKVFEEDLNALSNQGYRLDMELTEYSGFMVFCKVDHDELAHERLRKRLGL
jgi:hypothetical protein